MGGDARGRPCRALPCCAGAHGRRPCVRPPCDPDRASAARDRERDDANVAAPPTRSPRCVAPWRSPRTPGRAARPQPARRLRAARLGRRACSARATTAGPARRTPRSTLCDSRRCRRARRDRRRDPRALQPHRPHRAVRGGAARRRGRARGLRPDRPQPGWPPAGASVLCEPRVSRSVPGVLADEAAAGSTRPGPSRCARAGRSSRGRPPPPRRPDRRRRRHEPVDHRAEARADVHELRAERRRHRRRHRHGARRRPAPDRTRRDGERRRRPAAAARRVGLRDIPAGARVLDDAAATVAAAHPRPASRPWPTLHARDVRHVLLEGGPTLAAAFVRAGVVDEVIAVRRARSCWAPVRSALGDAGIATLVRGVAPACVIDVALVGDRRTHRCTRAQAQEED